MANYRIVCTYQEPVSQPTKHAHIVRVGTGTVPSTYTKTWTLNEVLAAMRMGDTFYTQGQTSGKTARVESYSCEYCGQTRIRSTPDRVTDNNLDSLPRCG